MPPGLATDVEHKAQLRNCERKRRQDRVAASDLVLPGSIVIVVVMTDHGTEAPTWQHDIIWRHVFTRSAQPRQLKLEVPQSRRLMKRRREIAHFRDVQIENDERESPKVLRQFRELIRTAQV